MSINTPETITIQKRYHDKKTEKSAQRKVDGVMKKYKQATKNGQ